MGNEGGRKDINKTWFILLGVMKPKCPLYDRRGKKKGWRSECVCLLEVEIMFSEGLGKEKSANQIYIKKKVRPCGS